MRRPEAKDGGLIGSGRQTLLQRQPDVVEADFREQSLEAEPILGRGPALARILVNDENAYRRPTEFDGPIDESIMAVGGVSIPGNLLLPKKEGGVP
jgi:hypothetical protein